MSRHVVRALLVLTLLGLAITPAPVAAHADLDTAAPGPDETVTGSPAELIVNFSQDLDPARSALVVRDAAGTTVAEGGEPGTGPRQLRLDLPELAPGVFEVRWTSWSAEDNEGHRGTYTFTVLAAPTPTPTPPPTPEPSATPTPTAAPTPTPSPSPRPSPTPSPSPAPVPTSDADSSAVIAIVAALFLLGALGAWLLRRRSA